MPRCPLFTQWVKSDTASSWEAGVWWKDHGQESRLFKKKK